MSLNALKQLTRTLGHRKPGTQFKMVFLQAENPPQPQNPGGLGVLSALKPFKDFNADNVARIVNRDWL